MTTATIDCIVIDDKGAARIAGSRSRVTDIVLDTRSGLKPEGICEAYPHLSMAQVHAALSYYYAHQTELDAEIERDLRDFHNARTQAGDHPAIKRLREAGKIP